MRRTCAAGDVATAEGWPDLAALIDLYTRKIAGRVMRESLRRIASAARSSVSVLVSVR